MHFLFDNVTYSPDASSNVNYFFLADVKCGLCEINKNNRANATHGPRLVQNMLRDRTEAVLNRRGPGPGPAPVLTVTETTSVKVWTLAVALLTSLQLLPLATSVTFDG